MIKSSGFKYSCFQFVLFFLCIVLFEANAQVKIKFDHLSINDGLSNNTINCIYKDSFGFIWIGTNDGLNRYDGYQFISYRNNREDSNSITGNKIYSITEDAQKQLWIGTRSGLSKYNREFDNFQNFKSDTADAHSISHNFIRKLYCDQKGRLWICTLGGGLNLYLQNGQFTNAGNFENVTSVITKNEYQLWVATTENGIYTYNHDSQKKSFIPFDEKIFQSANTGKTLFIDSEERLWICSEGGGLLSYDQVKNQFQHYTVNTNPALSSNIIKDILEFDKNILMLATDGGGLNLFDLNKNQVYSYSYDINDPEGITSDAIYTVYKDEQDIFWIGTFGGGLNIYNTNNKKFEHYTQEGWNPNSLSHKSVLCFTEHTDGKIWIGTDGGGLNLHNPQTGNFQHFTHSSDNQSISSDVITSLYLDNDNILWIGTYNGGLNRFNTKSNKTNQFINIPNDTTSLINNNVWDIEKDKSGNLWLATLGGLEKFEPKTGQFRHIKLDHLIGNRTNRILTLLSDSRNHLWIGGNFIAIRDAEGNLTLFNPANSDSRLHYTYDIRSIFEDLAMNIWIATEGGGLIKYSPETDSIIRLTEAEGLPNNSIHQVLEDESGFIWVSSNKGLSRINPATHEIKNFDIFDGLQSNQFSYAASLKAKDGKFYFGGINGFNAFYPGEIKDNPHVPPIVFTDFLMFNKPVKIGAKDSPLERHISLSKKISLPFKSVFTIEFTSLNFTSSSKNQYKYQLEGFSDTWNDIGSKRTATYTNLNPGDYTFKVMGSNNDGLWNPDPQSLEITILPPFWKTTAAYIFYALIIILLLLGFRSYLISRQKLRNDLLIKELEKQKMEEVNAMKLRFFTNISHEFRTPLTLIIGPLENLLAHEKFNATISNQLRMVYNNSQRLLRLINQLIEFRKIETGNLNLKVAKGDIIEYIKSVKQVFDQFAKKSNIEYNFYSNADSLETLFDHDKLDKIFYNLLSNAFKFTPDNGKISVSAIVIYNTPENNDSMFNGNLPKSLEIIVEDNGIGISKERLPRIFNRFYQVDSSEKSLELLKTKQKYGSGIGLALTRELVEVHKGKIFVESEENKGTKFIIMLPLEESAYSADEITSNLTSPNHFDQQLYELYNEEEIEAPTVNNVESKPDRASILIVEDNVELREFIKFNLQNKYNILEAENGKLGLEVANEEIPDLIICDIMMPVLDGIEMTRMIKQNENTNHIPVILLTARTAEEHKIEGIEAGAEDYIIKPFNSRILFAKIVNIIESRTKQQKKYQKDILIQPSNIKVESVESKFIKKALGIVENYISDVSFDVTKFVSEMGMSRSVLYRKMDAILGQSANEFIRNIRLKRAAQLLEQNQMSVSEIAYEVGFNDPQYFSKCFSKQFGKTPTAYASEFKSSENNSVEV